MKEKGDILGSKPTVHLESAPIESLVEMTASNAFGRLQSAFAFSSVEVFRRNSLYVQRVLQLWQTAAKATNASFALGLAMLPVSAVSN